MEHGWNRITLLAAGLLLVAYSWARFELLNDTRWMLDSILLQSCSIKGELERWVTATGFAIFGISFAFQSEPDQSVLPVLHFSLSALAALELIVFQKIPDQFIRDSTLRKAPMGKRCLFELVLYSIIYNITAMIID